MTTSATMKRSCSTCAPLPTKRASDEQLGYREVQDIDAGHEP